MFLIGLLRFVNFFSILNVKYCVQDVRTQFHEEQMLLTSCLKPIFHKPQTATQTCGPASQCRQHSLSELLFTWFFVVFRGFPRFFFSVFHLNIFVSFPFSFASATEYKSIIIFCAENLDRSCIETFWFYFTPSRCLKAFSVSFLFFSLAEWIEVNTQ